jgi:uridine kinase
LFSVLFIIFFLVNVPYPLKLVNPDASSTLSKIVGNFVAEPQIEKFTNLVFTFMDGTIACIAVMMYVYGVRSNEVYKERKVPIIIGIGGDSGAGKDTLCGFLRKVLGSKNVIQADGDDHHKWERGHQMWKVYTHLNPKANDLYLQFDQTRSLRKGMTVTRSVYNHETGRFSSTQMVEPNKYIVVSGLHPFYLNHMRGLIDIKIYLDTEEKLKTYWKIKRDTEERGHLKSQVISNIQTREEDSIKYIEPQKKYADIIIRYELVDSPGDGEIGDSSELRVVFILDNCVNIEPLVCELEKCNTIELRHSYEDADKQYFSVAGRIAVEQLDEIATSVVPNIDELVDSEREFESNLNGIVQIVVLCIISHTKLF